MLCSESQEQLAAAAMYIDSQAKILQQFQVIARPAQANPPPAPAYPPGNTTPTRPIAANDRYQRGFQRDWVPTCVVCGQKGHLPRDCRNEPLPAEEQSKLREKQHPAASWFSCVNNPCYWFALLSHVVTYLT